MFWRAIELATQFCTACGGQYLGNMLYEGSKYLYNYYDDQLERVKLIVSIFDTINSINSRDFVLY